MKNACFICMLVHGLNNRQHIRIFFKKQMKQTFLFGSAPHLSRRVCGITARLRYTVLTYFHAAVD
ncbi:hypothetical protein ACLUEY_17030 [Vreelandella aquamarina]